MNNIKKIRVAVLLMLGLSFFYVNAFEDGPGGEKDIFSVFDADRDGRISMEEMTMGMMKIVKMDKDGDHFITRDELQSKDSYSHFMMRFDSNKDGRLSMYEIPPNMRHKMMMKMDKNRDNFLTIDELTGEEDFWNK